MSISVVVPVWNGRDFLQRLLDSLESQTLPADELLAIDNGSEDGAPELARQRGARVIAMGGNAGFAAAVNRGIREARGDWIAVLNSDVELAPDYFALLTATGAWFASGKILSRSDPTRIDGTFDVVCRGGTSWRIGSGRADEPAFNIAREITSPPWTAAVFRADLFRRTGLLEEAFESYLEDVDFGLRCAAMKLAGCYVPSAVAWHHGSGALGRWHPETVRRITRNQLFLLARHYPASVLWRFCRPIAIAQILWAALAFRHGRPLAWFRGAWQGLAGFSKARAESKFEVLELTGHLRSNDDLIRYFQVLSGFDTYWRWYFLLTGRRAR